MRVMLLALAPVLLASVAQAGPNERGDPVVHPTTPAYAAGTHSAGVAPLLDSTSPPPPPPTGSCCFSNGTCTVTLRDDCPAHWTLSGGCDPNYCPAPYGRGACCTLQGTCAITFVGGCGPPSRWHPEWPGCDPNPCPLTEGACCTLDGACTLTFELDCDPASIWRGELIACEPNLCPALPAERTSWGRIKSRYR